ncbi:hypothetical protein J6590_043015 [Homalodisca vitripennis]|nr:hypothetical protein J6590_043015 [Homalodisca vitripennis]
MSLQLNSLHVPHNILMWPLLLTFHVEVVAKERISFITITIGWEVWWSSYLLTCAESVCPRSTQLPTLPSKSCLVRIHLETTWSNDYSSSSNKLSDQGELN